MTEYRKPQRLNPIAEKIGGAILERLESRYSEDGLDFLKRFVNHWEKLGYDMSKYRGLLDKYGQG